MNDDNRSAVVTRHLENLVAQGTPGAALPSSRQLARDLKASPVTIGRAVAALAARGLVVSEPGRGTFIAGRAARPDLDVSWQAMALPPARIDHRVVSPLDPASVDESLAPLSSGYLGAELQPRSALQAATARTIRRQEIWTAAPSAGLRELRGVFAQEVGLEPDQIIVTNGSQSGLALALRAVTEPGDPIAVENPTYPGALAAMRSAGLHPVPVPTDAHGVRPDDLERILERSGARIAYVQSAVNNPSGVTWTSERRRGVLDALARQQALVIDDDWARHLNLGAHVQAPPLIAEDRNGQVVHLTSLSKPVAPSLRIGYLAARGPALTRLHATAIADTLFVARPLQEVALELLTSPDWARHRRLLHRTLTARRDHIATLLAARWPRVDLPGAGLHLWVPCPPGWTSTGLTAAAREAGVIVGDGALSYADEAPEQRIRISFGALTEAAMSAAVGRIEERLEPGP